MFTPLSLTQALPFLPLAQSQVDYASEQRSNPDLFQQFEQEGSVSVMLVSGQRVALPFKSLEQAKLGGGLLRLALLPGEYLPSCLRPLAGAPSALYFLGSAGNQHFFALDLDLAGRQLSDEPGREQVEQFAQSAQSRFKWLDVKEFAPRGLSRDVGLATSALALSIWHNAQRYCSYCGAPIAPCENGWAQQCTQENPARILFPRIEPAVITAIVDSQDRLLLEHNSAWEPSLYSLCAGFVEPGENLEHAAKREAMEELQLPLGEIRYLGSQPWPFPASLMVAFKARALSEAFVVDYEETDCACWMTRDEYTAALATGRMSAPGKASVARYMIEQWYGREL
nr:NAD(+) diphosphatase [Bombiscardovia apis]